MTRCLAARAFLGLAVIAAVSCCSGVCRADTLAHDSPAEHRLAADSVVASLGGGDARPAAVPVSDAVMRSLASRSEAVGYRSGLAQPTFGSHVVRHAPAMGFDFENVPFESFLSVAAAPNGENVVRTFIIIENEKRSEGEATSAEVSGDDLVNRFTRVSPGLTTTSGSATLSILQVPPTSSSLVFTNVVLKGGPQVTE